MPFPIHLLALDDVLNVTDPRGRNPRKVFVLIVKRDSDGAQKLYVSRQRNGKWRVRDTENVRWLHHRYVAAIIMWMHTEGHIQ